MKEKVTNAFLYPSTLDKKHIPKKALTWPAWMTVPFDVSEGGHTWMKRQSVFHKEYMMEISI
jgi:hypothetical protein